MSTTTVHVVDDDEAVRDAVQFLLRNNGIASYLWPNAEDFLSYWHPDMHSCILLDARMTGMTGPECFTLLRERGCRSPVIFLTGHGDVPMAVEVLRQGALHFLEKPFDREALLRTVREGLAQEAHRIEELQAQAHLNHCLASLSPRELEVMERILDGKQNKVIADELLITVRTVEVHRASVFEKMGVRSAVELARRTSRQK